MPSLVISLVLLALLVSAFTYNDRRNRSRPLNSHDADEAARKARGRADGVRGGWTPGSGGSSM
jgi:hypothetical protein